MLAEFLSVRQQFIAGCEYLSRYHPYIIALKRILEGAGDYKLRYNVGRYSCDSLTRIFYEWTYIMLSGYDHMAIVEREGFGAPGKKPVWKVYQFDYNGIFTVKASTYALHTTIFPNPYFLNELLINGYMRISKS